MKTQHKCIPCLISQGAKVSTVLGLDKEIAQSITSKIEKSLQGKEYSDVSPPFLAKDIYRLISEELGGIDPYKDLKEFYNREIMSMHDELKAMVDESDNRLFTALKMAVAGNIIDFGTSHSIDEKLIKDQIKSITKKEFALDNSSELFEKLQTAKTLLYLGDNCGEIVFDKIFIEEIKEAFSHLEINFAVRGSFVLNDVTIDDAKQVGMDKIVTVIDNGDSSPGTILLQCKDEFVKIFHEADVIISKGQGNFESLYSEIKENIFFLFMTKCELITESLDVPMFSLMCKRGEKS